VYQKTSRSTTRVGAEVCEIKCKRFACAIQRCFANLPLSRSRVTIAGVDVSKCRHAVDAYDACCARAKAAQAALEGESAP